MCDLPLSPLALGVITFRFFSCTYSPTCFLLPVLSPRSFLEIWNVLWRALIKKIFFNVCVCIELVSFGRIVLLTSEPF